MYKKIPGRFGRIVFLSLLVFSFFIDAAEPYPGYTLIASGSRAYLYDIEKEKVHEWKASGGSAETPAYLLPDGSVLFPLDKGGCPFRPGGAHPNGTFEIVSWEGETLWSFKFCESNFTPSYDVEPLPDGNILVIAGYDNANRPGRVFELKPVGKNDGEVVWSLSAPVTVHRAYRYGKDYPGVSELNQTNTIGKAISNKNSSLRVVYNQHRELVNLTFTNKHCRARVCIFALNGREVFSKITTQSELVIHTKRFTDGLYIVQVESSTELLKTNLFFIR